MLSPSSIYGPEQLLRYLRDKRLWLAPDAGLNYLAAPDAIDTVDEVFRLWLSSTERAGVGSPH